jgi:F420-dependent oxidoreductase-like protein
MEVAIMIEGQDGLNWTRWKRLARAVEDLGYIGLYRSDHFTNSRPPDKDSLELWVSLTWLACNTEKIEFGPLVSPVSFRHPTLTARMAAAVDDLCGGRLTLGLGAGWQEREHEHFGHDLLDIDGRFDRFEEGLRVIRDLLQSDEPVNFEGEYYSLKDAILLPRPKRTEGPPILIGGNGAQRTLPLVARYADEWNALYIPIDQYRSLSARLDQLLEDEGRKPLSVRRSLMTGCEYGRTKQEVDRKVEARTKGNGTIESLRQRGVIVGTAPEIKESLLQFQEAGVQRVMLQWLDQDDLDGLESLARGIL